MKVRVSVVIITLLFSLGGLAFGVQALQKKGTTPLAQATPSNGAGARRSVDQPARAPATQAAETPSPAQVASQQQTVSPNLEESLVGLTNAVTKLVDKQAKEESGSKSLDLLTGLAGALGALLTLGGTVIAYRKRSWFEEIKPFIPLILIAVGLSIILLVSLYLLSGLVTAVLYGFTAIVILLIALLIAGAHLLTFIDNNPELKARVSTHFPELFGDSAASQPSSSGDPLGEAASPTGSSGS